MSVRLLFDESLSESLRTLLDIYPYSQHVRALGLQGRSDAEIAAFAANNGLVIVSKDADFVDMAILAGPAFRAIRVRLGNCTTEQVHQLLRESLPRIQAFMASDDAVLQLPEP